MEHAIVALYLISKNDMVNGRINRIRPVILFIVVCGKINFFVRKNLSEIFPVLMMAIIVIHAHNQLGMWIVILMGILGIMTSISTAKTCIRSLLKEAEEASGSSEPPLAFNDHD